MKSDYNIFDIVKDIVQNKLELASPELVKARNDVCNSCEAQHKPTHICSACGCFLPTKTRILKTDCPMELWPDQK